MSSPTEPKPHFLTDQKIIISGAGISGLAFAYSLHKLWPSTASPPPPLTLYERDPSAVPKNREGYSLSLRSDGPSAGIQTLQKMGLLDKMLEVSIAGMGGASSGKEGRSDGGGFCLWNKEFKKVMKIKTKIPEGCPVSGMRIARANLRRTLVEAVEVLPGVTIKWDETVTSVSTGISGGRMQIETSKGKREACDILIAADGSASKLRTFLRPTDTLRFAGPTCIYGTTSITPHHPTSRSDEFGSAISGEGKGLFIAPVDHEKMIWCLSWHVQEAPVVKRQPTSEEDVQALVDEVRKKGRVFGERFEKMVNDTETSSLTQFNALDKQPFAHSGRYIEVPELEKLNGRIVFLGDANHAVSPFAGNGANLALMDGWSFAESLVESPSLEEAVAKYDELAVGRAKKVISMSHFSIRVMHCTGWALWFWMTLLSVLNFLFFRGA